MNFNPFAVALQNYSNCRNSGNSAYNCAVVTLDPAYSALNGYSNEISSAQSSCSYLTSLSYGAQGVIGVAGTEAIGYAGAESANGLFAGSSENESATISGFTRPGLERALGRDGGTGVSDLAMADAVSHPVAIEVQAAGASKYIGENAIVVLNSNGEVITTWATNSAGWRNTP